MTLWFGKSKPHMKLMLMTMTKEALNAVQYYQPFTSVSKSMFRMAPIIYHQLSVIPAKQIPQQ